MLRLQLRDELRRRRAVEPPVVQLEDEAAHEGVTREEDEPRVLLLDGGARVGERRGGLDGEVDGRQRVQQELELAPQLQEGRDMRGE